MLPVTSEPFIGLNGRAELWGQEIGMVVNNFTSSKMPAKYVIRDLFMERSIFTFNGREKKNPTFLTKKIV